MAMKSRTSWLELQTALIDNFPDTCVVDFKVGVEDMLPFLLVRRTELAATEDSLEVIEFSDDDSDDLLQISDGLGILARAKTIDSVVEAAKQWLSHTHSYQLVWKDIE